MNELNLYSNNEFMLEINSNNYIIDELNSLQITDYILPIVIKVYPINQSRLSIPFCIKLDNKNNSVFCDSEFCKIYKFKNRYDIFIFPFMISGNICLYTETHTVKNIKYIISCFEDRIQISCNKGIFTYEVSAKNFSSTTENNHIFILCKNSLKHLIVFNCLNNTFYEIIGNKIEIENNSIKSLKTLNDIANHTVVCSYKVNENIEIISTDLYTKDTNKKIPTKEICALNFFEALKINDFKLANSLLHSDLKQKISNDTLKNYFGNFDIIKINSISPLIFTLYNYNDAKDYCVTLKDDLIFDIEEV